MKRQLQGISLILMGILLSVCFGNEPFFDLDFAWSVIFSAVGIVGVILTFLPEKHD